jgi:hypothetical protein
MMAELLLLLGLSAEPPVYPPKDVILLQNSPVVPLRWSLPGRHFKVEQTSQGRTLWSGETYGNRQEVYVAPGQPIHWVITELAGQGRYASDFTRGSEYEYHADGKDGSPGDSLEIRLGRDQNGMNLLLLHRGLRRHYLFGQPNLRFRVSCRGGAGLPGRDGGPGGHILVTTDSAPWRDFLDLDVTGGKAGGKGTQAHDGAPGVVETRIEPIWR